jgi:hypothetical protein
MEFFVINDLYTLSIPLEEQIKNTNILLTLHHNIRFLFIQLNQPAHQSGAE